MKSEAVVGVQPSVMRWARESSGMSISDVAARLKKPYELVEAWESGELMPTYIQLETLAYDLFKRPLALFFLPEPPLEKLPKQEFRTLPVADLNRLKRDTHLHIRKAHAYQVSLKEFYENKNPSEVKIWKSISLSSVQSVASQAETVRCLLDINIQQQASWGDDDIALKRWRKAIEDVGIFVFKDSFEQKEISGFCLSDNNFPVIYLNNSTTKTRQIFSLLHELAHVLFNVNGLSKFDRGYIGELPLTERRIETFCNSIAAEILIPSDDFNSQIKQLPFDTETHEDIAFMVLAKRYGVSREAILRRFLDLNRVTQSFYELKAAEWNGQKRALPGGHWFNSQGAYLSDRFMREVFSSHYKNQISVEQASNFLGIKAKNFAGLEDVVLKRAYA